MSQSSVPQGPPPLPATAGQVPAADGWRFSPHAIIFFSSACIMTLELVAGRLIARNLGSSLYTWTSIIGTVLAGMSLGNYVGGRMADRWRPRKSLGWLFLISSAACLATLLLSGTIADDGWLAERISDRGLNLPTRIVLSTVALFLVPSLMLGTISPVTAKLALDRSQKAGRAIGSVYAWGAIGSILGTFAAGFWLIALLGSRGVMLSVAFVLAIIGLFLGPWRILHALWVAAVAALLWLSQTTWDPAYQYACAVGLQEGEEAGRVAEPSFWRPKHQYERPVFAKDSRYQFVKAYSYPDDDSGLVLHKLELDNLLHGYVCLEDLSHLEYDYEKVYGALARVFVGERKEVSAFFLGGGSYTFPRWMQQEWPQAQCDVAELDPLVLEVNHQALGLPRDTTIRTFLNDARVVANQLPARKQYNLILADAFNDLAPPWHLTTLEFHRRLQKLLRTDGVLLANIIDDIDCGLFLGAYVQTVNRIFRHVFVFCTSQGGASGGRDTFVVASTDAEDAELLEHLATFQPGHGLEFPGSLVTEEQLATLKDRCGGRILTDDNAPVENLLEPVIRRKKD